MILDISQIIVISIALFIAIITIIVAIIFRRKERRRKMKKIMMSIRPEWVAKIFNYEKTIEVRSNKPNCDLPVLVYIYCSKGTKYLDFMGDKWDTWDRKQFKQAWCYDEVLKKYHKPINPYEQKVIGAFEVRFVTKDYDEISACVSKRKGYGWDIHNLIIFNEPRELKEFGIDKAPQSWQYIKELGESLFEKVRNFK